MRKIIDNLMCGLMRIKHLALLPRYSGTYLISPKPKYISQFVSIYPSSINLKTPLKNKKDITKFGAKNSKEFSFWAWRDCGIACIKMILETKKEAKDKTIMDLTNEGVKLNGYVLHENGVFIDKGWFHNGLVALLNKYNVSAKMKKWQSIESIAKDILENRMLIISVIVPGRNSIKEDGSFAPKPKATFGGHLLLGIGVKMNGKKIEGIYVHDPRGLPKYQANTYIPKRVFNTIFTGRTIVAK